MSSYCNTCNEAQTAAPKMSGNVQRVPCEKTAEYKVSQDTENVAALANGGLVSNVATPEKTRVRLPDRSPAKTPRQTNLSMTPSRVPAKMGNGTSSVLRSPAKRALTPMRPGMNENTQKEPVGSVMTYAQVRATKAQKQELGVDTLVSPVRHCSRNRTPGREVNPNVQRLLEESNFAYSPNRSLNDANLDKSLPLRPTTPFKAASQDHKARKVLEFGE